MSRITRRIALLLWLGLFATTSQASEPGVEGNWNGTLMGSLRIVFHLKQGADGAMTATMDSPDQGASGIPMEVESAAPDSVRLVFRAGDAVFRGRWVAGKDQLEGTWSQRGANLALVLARGDVAPPKRPQHPVPPFPYAADSVTFASADGVMLAGTLTHPRTPGRRPAIVLVSGSGQQDRDEELSHHRPFLVLADRLTREGFVVLRYDDRGVGGSGGDPVKTTLESNAADVKAAVAHVRARTDVDPKRVAIIGHSEGGLLAPMVAASDARIAAIVLLAGPGVMGDSVLAAQMAAALRFAGGNEAEVARRLAPWRTICASLHGDAPPESLEAGAVRTLQAFGTTLSEAEQRAIGGVERWASTQAKAYTGSWMRSFVRHDPALVLRRVKCPVLALNGGKDQQVDPRINLPPIRAALAAGGNRAAECEELPGLNHMFQTAATGFGHEYATIEETFAPAALDRVATWLVARLRPSR